MDGDRIERGGRPAFYRKDEGGRPVQAAWCWEPETQRQMQRRVEDRGAGGIRSYHAMFRPSGVIINLHPPFPSGGIHPNPHILPILANPHVRTIGLFQV